MRKSLICVALLWLSGCGASATVKASVASVASAAPSPTVTTTPKSVEVNPSTTTFVAQLLAVDQTGHVYFSDCLGARVYRVDSPGRLTVVAGDGALGSSGDGGPATAAELSCPAGLAFDSQGDLYIVDHNNDAIRMVDPAGTITTVASQGFNEPWGITVDASGQIYVADRNNNAVESVNAAGDSSVVAGAVFADAGYSGDGGPATKATMDSPLGVAVDAQGNIYVADSNNNRIRKIDTHGIITTFAGTGKKGSSGDGGPATAATLNDPQGMAFDGRGNLYVLDTGGKKVRKIDTHGLITTYAGTGKGGSAGMGGPARSAELADPGGIAFDAKGDLFIANRGNGCVLMVDPAGVIHTVVCSGP